MSSDSIKHAIERALAGFGALPLAEAATALFDTLGYRSTRRIPLKPNSADEFRSQFDRDGALNAHTALLDEWRSVDFLFQLTGAEISAAGQGLLEFDVNSAVERKNISSYLFFAIELNGKEYSRTQLASITREVNKLFLMPALLLFKHGETLTLSIITRRPHKRDAAKDVLEKVTLIKDIRIPNPHRAHIEILSDLSLAELYRQFAFSTFVELQAAWSKTLDTSLVNKRFYADLANWYFWALKNVTFPKEAPKDRDGRDAISLIRLITRIIFCWFLKEKGLIEETLFDERKVRDLLNSLGDDRNTYYTAILQNLFFATLNTEMDVPHKPKNRRFIKSGDKAESEDHMIHNVWRYEDRIKNTDLFETCYRRIPFLNGGLFECLDERVAIGSKGGTEEKRIDGFSVKAAKQPRVPNSLFFGDKQRVDLSGVYGEARARQSDVWPLITLLHRYKFTITENTPIEEEVALDPELLGHVFENLLAAYNPETDSSARKTSGSVYTPRIVVDFMVDEALAVYLENSLIAADIPSKRRTVKLSAEAAYTDKIRLLLSYSIADPEFSPDETSALIDAIDRVKILDPACGSGAYPMGALHKLVFILRKLDRGNEEWKSRQLAKARELDVGRDAAEDAIEAAFARDSGDYARKLYLIENCLYGVDIQPIAIQIAKLRCFISLVVEQQPDDALPNRGILPLPNLETKFIAANTLVGLHRSSQLQLVAPAVERKKTELRKIRHDHFRARRYSEKKALRKRDGEVRAELGALLKSDHLLSGAEADMVATWDPYHGDHAAPFFDAEWMFNLAAARKRTGATILGKLSLVNDTAGQMEMEESDVAPDGFDIVIGNPPYVRQEEVKNMRALEGTPAERPLKEVLKDDYFCYTGVADLFVYFYEKSFDLLAPGGVLCFISSNKYFRSGYGERLRHFLVTNGNVRLLIDFGDASIFTAIAYPSIILVRKTRETHAKEKLISRREHKRFEDLVNTGVPARALSWVEGPPLEDFPAVLQEHSIQLSQKDLTPEGWRLESRKVLNLLEKLRRAGPPLGEYVKGKIYRGILTGLNEAFIVDHATRDRLIAEDKRSREVLKPCIRGRDVKRWRVNFAEQYLIKIESTENEHHPWSNKPVREAERVFEHSLPAIYAWFKPMRDALMDRTDQGKYWWELRSCAYWEDCDGEKIVWGNLGTTVGFALDTKQGIPCAPANMLATEELWLLGLLNSRVADFFFHQLSAIRSGGFLEFKPMYVAQLPVPPASQSDRQALLRLSEERAETKINGIVARLFDLTNDELKLLQSPREMRDKD